MVCVLVLLGYPWFKLEFHLYCSVLCRFAGFIRARFGIHDVSWKKGPPYYRNDLVYYTTTAQLKGYFNPKQRGERSGLAYKCAKYNNTYNEQLSAHSIFFIKFCIQRSIYILQVGIQRDVRVPLLRGFVQNPKHRMPQLYNFAPCFFFFSFS